MSYIHNFNISFHSTEHLATKTFYSETPQTNLLNSPIIQGIVCNVILNAILLFLHYSIFSGLVNYHQLCKQVQLTQFWNVIFCKLPAILTPITVCIKEYTSGGTHLIFLKLMFFFLIFNVNYIIIHQSYMSSN